MRITSIPCPRCTPSEHWEAHRRTNPDIKPLGDWDVYGDTAECTNCSHERKYRRQNKNTKPTKAQNKKSSEVQAYFKHHVNRGEDLFEVIENFQEETGDLWLSIHTANGNSHIEEGGFFKVGRRGGITCMHIYGLSKVFNEQYYNEELRGYIPLSKRGL